MRNTSADSDLRDILEWALRELQSLQPFSANAPPGAQPHIKQIGDMLEDVRAEAYGARFASDPSAKEALRLKDRASAYLREHEHRWR